MSSPPPETSPTTNSTASPTPPEASPATNSTVPPPATNDATVSPPPPPATTDTTNSVPPPPIADSGGLPRGTLNGIIIGVVLGSVSMLIIGGIFFCLYRNRKRKHRHSSFSQPPQPKVDLAGDQLQHWQASVPPTADGKVDLTPKPPRALVNQQQLSAGLPTPGVNSSNTSSSLGSEKPYASLSPGISLALSQSTFTYDELAIATDGFSKSNLLGQGGFGYVHKGVLPNGKIVAVKQLKSESRQGEREFHAEVEVISRVHHRHLVSLVGYCISDSERMLVYEFVPNKTLEFHLHGKDRPSLYWSTRMKIATGSAKGLAYLHEDCNPRIIHRDIKASNILLDNNFEAKVADFGLAKFSSDTETHVSTRVMGTFGYMAPEYAASGKLTEKSDVFSFGIVLLELITGRKPVDKTQSFTDDSMVEWMNFPGIENVWRGVNGFTVLHSLARPLLSQALENGNFDGLVDPRLQTNYNLDEIIRMTACAATCVRHSARRRPRMSQVVRALEGNISLEDLNEGSTPGHSRVFGSFESSNYDTVQYSEDLKKFRKLALESQELGVSECSGPSSEYGQHPSVSTSSGQQNTQEMEMGNMKGSSHGSGMSS